MDFWRDRSWIWRLSRLSIIISLPSLIAGSKGRRCGLIGGGGVGGGGRPSRAEVPLRCEPASVEGAVHGRQGVRSHGHNEACCARTEACPVNGL